MDFWEGSMMVMNFIYKVVGSFYIVQVYNEVM